MRHALPRHLTIAAVLALALALLAPAAGAAQGAEAGRAGFGPVEADATGPSFAQANSTCVDLAPAEDLLTAVGGRSIGFTVDTTESSPPDFTAQVDWGDGTAPTTVQVQEQREYTLEHVYQEPGEFEAVFQADGSIGGTACSNPPTTVANITALPDLTTRLFGDDRLATSQAISQDLWNDDAASSVTLARADEFPDALAGTALAIAKQGPLLLTPVNELAPGTEEELMRVLPETGTVYLLGGEAALDAGVEEAVEDLGYDAVRLGGSTRLDTAALIADEIDEAPETILLTWGFDFPDALVAGSVAGNVGAVVLLTEEGGPGDATAAYLEEHDDADLIAIGGVASVAVPDAEAIVGANRFDTSVRVAEAFYPDATSFAVASGGTFPDALGGGAHAGQLGIPLFLSGADVLAEEVFEYLRRSDRVYDPGYLYGGRLALSTEVAALASLFLPQQ
jgi:putative cell wall-binding protein